MQAPEKLNRLAQETSPYLLQHARNPVDWYPWGEEALEKARKEDKPIFLSIGYSACHWCHVMERESFENEATAKIMNALFVNIKVDREERPDIDNIYMKAVIALNGQGGWPMSVFLTPDQEPYWGGTYFPPTSGHNRPGFPQVLEQAAQWYRDNKDQTADRAKKILQRMMEPAATENVGPLSADQLINASVDMMKERYDETFGGFGSGMKFPEPAIYSLLLRHWLRTGEGTSIEMVDKTLTRMAEGGLYDQLGGGFHRYSTDRKWLVPHFEKMLYDNALLTRLYTETFQATKQEIYKTTAEGVVDYVLREMTSEEGGFYSTQDADTEGEEGRFFVWELKQVLEALGPRNAKVFARAYGMSPSGNFEGKNVLHVSMSMEKVAELEGVPIFEVNHILNMGRKTLFELRAKRTQPETDTKMLVAWNGMMVAALANGYAVFRHDSWLQAAEKCAGFIWDTMWTDDNGLLRVYKDGRAHIKGFLDDYAWTLESLVTLYQATFDTVWVERAIKVADRLLEDFWDEDEGGLFLTGNRHETLVHRPKNSMDDALPSANSIAALALMKLAVLTGKETYREKGEGILKTFHSEIASRPAAHNGLLSALDFKSKAPVEMVFVGPKDHPAFEELLKAAQEDFRPNKILLHASDDEARKHLPLTEGKVASKGEPAVYVCQNETCHPPVQTGQALQNLLERPPMIRLNIFDEEKDYQQKTANETNNFLNAMNQMFKHTGLGGRGK